VDSKKTRAQWRENNRDRIRAYDRARYALRPEVVKQRASAWRAVNPDRAREIRRRWREKNRDKINEAARQNKAGSRRWRNHRVSDEMFQARFDAQGRRCAVCETDTTPRWALDHDHKTGAVRQILCNGCNLALGHMKDDDVRLRAAAEYVIRHRVFGDIL
jgi:recombination endonuclease VII